MTKVFEPDEAQERVIEMASTTESGAFLNGSGTGVGKTYIATKVAVNRNAKRALIIGPPNTFDNWEATLKALTGQALLPCGNTKIGHHTKAEAQANMAAVMAGADGWYFVGREMFNKQNWEAVIDKATGLPMRHHKTKKPVMKRLDIWGKKRKFDVAIFDEVQMCSSNTSKTRQSWQHLQVKDPEQGGFRIAQSADWFGGQLVNQYTVAHDLWPGHSGLNRTEWIDEYMVTEFDRFSFTKKKVVGEQWPGFYAGGLPCYAALPSPIDKPEPEPRWVDLSPAQRKLYDKLVTDLAAEIDGDLLVIEMNMHLTMRLRELTLGLFHPVETTRKNKETGEDEPTTTIDYRVGDPSTTIDEIKAIMRDYPNEPILVLTHSQKFAVKAAAELGGLPYTGAQSLTEKKEAERAFKAGEVKVLVGTDSITEGLDGLQEVCRLSVYASRLWTTYKNEQFLGRTARRGQERPVIAFEIMRRDTVDEDVIPAILAKTLKLNAAKAIEAKQKKEAA